MSDRTCERCRFWHREELINQNGQCRRYPPSVIMPHGLVRPTMAQDNSCGEWRDRSITPEQEQRDELVRRFAVALVGTEWCYNPDARDFTPAMVWHWAEKLADAEPKIGGES